MKLAKIMLPSLLLAVGCTNQPKQEPQMALDMNTVTEYNNKVQHGNTVPASARKTPQTVEHPLNASDSQSKQTIRQTVNPNVVLVPSFGYYHNSRHWRHW